MREILYEIMINKVISLKHSVKTKSIKCSLFSILREPSLDRKDLLALTLVGPPRDNPKQDPQL